MKKLICLLISVLLCFTTVVAVGCGGTGDPGDSHTYEGVEFNDKSGEMYKDTKEGKTAIKVTYSIGYGDHWVREMARQFLLSDFGANYYMVVKGDSELTAGLSSKLEAGTNLSDIYMPLASGWYSNASLGYLEKLDDVYSAKVPGEDKTVLEKMTGTWKDGYGKMTTGGSSNYYVFPWNENVCGIVYNKTMFAENKWTVPTTVAELDALCKTIVNSDTGVAPFAYPGAVGGGYWDFIGTNWWLQYAGIEKMQEMFRFESADVFNSEIPGTAAEARFKMVKTFYNLIVKNKATYTLRGSASDNHLKSQQNFAQGRAAMIPNGSWIFNESGNFIDDELGMMRVPYVDENTEKVNYNYGGQPDFMIIPSAAKNKDGAKEFLKFMCRDDMLKKYSEMTGAARPFAYDTTNLVFENEKATGFFKDCFEIHRTSTTWFENSTSQLWTSGQILKFNSLVPYTYLLTDDQMTPAAWDAQEYAGAVEKFNQLG